ncbi:hypothetical protein H7I56_12790 [Mycolicibacterium gilvum]|nr:hypothetical protein [Mycolicibacterium gilvum]
MKGEQVPNKFVDVPIGLDEVALAHRGWSCLDARARLKVDNWSRLSVSLELSHDAEAWTNRFIDPDFMLSPLVLEVTSVATGLISYASFGFRDAASAVAGDIHEAVSGVISYGDDPVSASDLRLKLTSFDAADVPLSIRPLQTVRRPLKVQFRSASAGLDALDHEIDVDAYVSSEDPDDEEVTVCVRGVTTMAAYRKLVEVTASRDEGHEDGEFEIRLPNVQVDVLDETDFLLKRFEATHYMEVSGASADDVPKRAAEWVDFFTESADELAGEPSKVVVRLVQG